MRYFASVVTILALCAWLGSLGGLFLFADAVFRAFEPDRVTAGRATSAMFMVFSQLQLFAAAGALVGVFLLYLSQRRKAAVAMFFLLGIGALGSAAFKIYFVPRIESLRISAQTQSDAFKSLHGQSMATQSAVGLALAICVVLLPAAMGSAEKAPINPDNY